MPSVTYLVQIRVVIWCSWHINAMKRARKKPVVSGLSLSKGQHTISHYFVRNKTDKCVAVINKVEGTDSLEHTLIHTHDTKLSGSSECSNIQELSLDISTLSKKDDNFSSSDINVSHGSVLSEHNKCSRDSVENFVKLTFNSTIAHSLKNENVCSEDEKLGILEQSSFHKREAEHGTGVSPASKRSENDTSASCRDSCKVDISSRFDESKDLFSSSFASLIPSSAEHCPADRVESSKSKNEWMDHNSFEQSFKVGDDDDVQISEISDSFMASQNFTTDRDDYNLINEAEDSCVYAASDITKEVNVNKQCCDSFIMNAAEGKLEQKSDAEQFLDIDNEDLVSILENMSPFKCSQKCEGSEVRYHSAGVRPVELIGRNSFASTGNFNRYFVTKVEKNPYDAEMSLVLNSCHNGAEKSCTLKGFWYHAFVQEGNYINIIDAVEEAGHFIVDDYNGLIVVNPDFLISGTCISSAVFCRRKALFSELCRGLDSRSKQMILGCLIHEMFQKAAQEKITSSEELNSILIELMKQPKLLRDLYCFNLSEDEVIQEVQPYIPQVISWVQRYRQMNTFGGSCTSRKGWNGKIVDVVDIEENYWSPFHGIKGKLDLTVQSELNGLVRVSPLELKTGKPSHSAEHRGQVILYSLIAKDRYENVGRPLLLYLSDGSMEEVLVKNREKGALIQLRNDLVYFLTLPLYQVKKEGCEAALLPEPLNNDRLCSKCPYLTCCSLYLHCIEDSEEEVTDGALSHLTQNHFDYFRRWCLMIHLEVSESLAKSQMKNLWCQDAAKRETEGQCISGLVLCTKTAVSMTKPDIFLHCFVKQDNSDALVRSNVFQNGESVIVSSNTEICVSQGSVAACDFRSIWVELDRNLKIKSSWKSKTFQIDRWESHSVLNRNFTNLVYLCSDNPRSDQLRRLLIDREKPTFKMGLSKDIVLKGKALLRPLNAAQQRAVLKALTAEDYLIVKGFPGTGKTALIVALVKILVILGKTILVTSYTHSALDNILLKLKEDCIDFLRLGQSRRVHPQVMQNSEEELMKSLNDVSSLANLYDSKAVVATTALGVNHVIFQRRTFDYCIVDEASQVLQTTAIGPLFYSSRFVLVGDVLQLPPVIRSKQARDLGMDESLLVPLDNQDATVTLNEQYRMNSTIMNLANSLTYSGMLELGDSSLDSDTPYEKCFKCCASGSSLAAWQDSVLAPDIKNAVVFIDTCGEAPEMNDENGIIINRLEAKVVLQLVTCIIKMKISSDDVGIITPYRSQVSLLSRMIQDGENSPEFSYKEVEVSTVDQYQGRDKSVIMFSCVRSGATAQQLGEILQDKRRLNVAITRARHKLIFIGDHSTLSHYTPFKRIFECLETHQIYSLKSGKDGFRGF